MTSVLLIDDEQRFTRVLTLALSARGHEVITAATGEEGISAAALNTPDVIILDLGLPDLDGIEVCRRLRQWTETPIIVLSADGTESRKVEAFDEGADDFVTKPFGLAELEARVRVAARRATKAPSPVDAPVIEVGPLRIDLATRRVTVEGREVTLTAREFDVLAFLARHQGRVITHRLLLAEVWGPEYADGPHHLRVYANHLRKKIEPDPAHPVLLITVPGVGYQLVAPPSAAEPVVALVGSDGRQPEAAAAQAPHSP
jgi:two-component system KDP operon response regulator KdpE